MRLIRVSVIAFVLGLPAFAWAEGGATASQGGAGASAGGVGQSSDSTAPSGVQGLGSGANPGLAGTSGRRQPTAASVPPPGEKDHVQQRQEKSDREMDAVTGSICRNCGVKR